MKIILLKHLKEYDEEDIKGLLSNRLDSARERLETAYESLEALFEPVSTTKDTF
ncbi:MAG: hypothetical protein U5K84_03130 [Alkalibacterium sp.]|nr:hypothetical protein [Alkalibacterium sp.]